MATNVRPKKSDRSKDIPLDVGVLLACGGIFFEGCTISGPDQGFGPILKGIAVAALLLHICIRKVAPNRVSQIEGRVMLAIIVAGGIATWHIAEFKNSVGFDKPRQNDIGLPRVNPPPLQMTQCGVSNNHIDIMAETDSQNATGVVIGSGVCGNDMQIQTKGIGKGVVMGSPDAPFTIPQAEPPSTPTQQQQPTKK